MGENKTGRLQCNKKGNASSKIGLVIVFFLLAFNIWTFVSKYKELGIQGNVVNNTSAAPPILTTDMIIFIAQWVVLIILVVFLYLRHIKRTRLEHTNINLAEYEKFKNVRGGTDIDVLFSILQEKKEIGLSTIEKLFKIDSEKALKWCKILEEHNLATIYYPIFSEPRVRKAG